MVPIRVHVIAMSDPFLKAVRHGIDFTDVEGNFHS